MNEKPKRRLGCLPWGVAVIVLLLIICFPLRYEVEKMANQSMGVHHCRSLVLCLKQFSKDNGSAYPDGLLHEFKSSNQVFRVFFKEDIVNDERVFGCPWSHFHPDDQIGEPPDFEATLMPGECHWMLLKHQTDVAHPKTPIIIENSLEASWPPKWRMPHSLASLWVYGPAKREKGEAWPGREIIIGRNDGSAQVEKLHPDGTLDWHSAPNLGPDGKSWIDSLTPEQIAKLEYWDIEEK